MPVDVQDVQQLILTELHEIKAEVRHMPRMQAQMDAMKGATQMLDTAMRETTAGLRMQGEAHGQVIDELRLQVHQSISSMMGISNDVQSLMSRMRDMEKQVTASFQQQQQLAKDVRAASCFPDPDEYKALKAEVDTLPVLRADVIKIGDEVKKHVPWLNGIEWFLRILFYALASSAVIGLLWLLGMALTNGLR